VAGVAVVVFAPGKVWQNDLSALTPIPKAELQRDARLRAELGAPDVRYLLVMRAPTAEGVLGLSERIAPLMRRLVAEHAVDGFELPSRFLPSIATQTARQAKLPAAPQLQSALQQAMQGLPFRAGVFAPFVADVEAARKLPPLTPGKFEQSPLGARLESMLVQQGEGWAGLGTLSGVNDPAAFAALSKETGGAVHLLDLKGSTESLIIAYRHRRIVVVRGGDVCTAQPTPCAARAGPDDAGDAAGAGGAARLRDSVVAVPSRIADAGRGPGPALRAILRTPYRRRARGFAHAACHAGVRRLRVAGVRRARAVERAGAARDRPDRGTGRCPPLHAVGADGAGRTFAPGSVTQCCPGPTGNTSFRTRDRCACWTRWWIGMR